MTTTPLLIAVAFGAIACAVYVARLFASAPLRDRDERLVSDAEGERLAS